MSLTFIIHIPPFINSQNSTRAKIKFFYCAKFVMAPLRGFCLVRKMQEFTTEFSK